MDQTSYGEWLEMEAAPRDGTRILVMIKASEQGPAEVDVARWARPDRSHEACWIASDSDHDCAVVYGDSDLDGWMALPSPLPKLRRGVADVETSGSGI
jgi:hypothetical protein